MRLDGAAPKRVMLLPNGPDLPWVEDKGYVHFGLPQLETLAMVSVEF